ncbi:calcium-binding protein [Streptomyces sp. NPDC058251]|uniref:calcium-binding protein n=1 Tax=unclassified Streptomyces TaxID=2593676 RepID=UPI0033CEBF83
MLIRSVVAALSGALALSALVVPSAHADAGEGDTQVTEVAVNDGKPVVVGATGAKTFTLRITARDDSGISDAYGWLYHGPFDNPDGFAGPGSEAPLTCTPVSATVTDSVCTASITVTPVSSLTNTHAGTWHVWTSVDAKDGDFVQKDSAAAFLMKRAARLTADASPEPVAKGEVITIKGALSRADWHNGSYPGYKGQSVKLQFRKAGTTTYSTVKTVTSGTGGTLKTTTTAVADGYWRWSFTGTSTTGAVNATGDYVHVTAG